MWVKMQTLAYRAMLKTVMMDAAMATELQTETRQISTQVIYTNAAYAAWQYAYDQLYANNFGPRGGRSRYGKKSGFTAMRNITKELNYIRTHPAFKGVAMFGFETETFPAWKIEVEPVQYSPYPQPGNEFVVLTPRWQHAPSHNRPDLTWWVPETSGEGRLADEQLHLALWRRPVR